MSDLKAAVIGTGGAARLHMQAYAAGRHTVPVAVVSRDAQRAEEFAAEFGVRGYTSVAEMLDRERLRQARMCCARRFWRRRSRRASAWWPRRNGPDAAWE
jgi:predicted dehydrogenase